LIKGAFILNIIVCSNDDWAVLKIRRAVSSIAVKMNLDFNFVLFSSHDELLFHYDSFADHILLVILDEDQKAGMDGIYAAQVLREAHHYHGPIVFISKNSDKSVAAYEVHAFYYIVKNMLSQARLEDIIREALYNELQNQKKRILLHGKSEYRYISLRSIYVFEIKCHTMTVRYGKNESFDFCCTMNELEERLKDKGFIRVHRSFIINTEKIKKATYLIVTLINNVSIPVGRKYYPNLKEYLTDQEL